ncbi:hypothetical protein ABZ372_37695 [Streptomyces sp. NPDC005921]
MIGGWGTRLLRERALALYAEKIRAHRVLDRGALLPPEHGGAYDNNYGPISLSFLAQAHRISGAEMFAEDGDALARYIDARLTNGGFDNGGPRYSEQHSAFESVLGLRYFGARIGSDLGRYRGDTNWGRHAVKPDGGVDGHFAWMLVWQIQDTTPWHRTPSTAPARHRLRAGSVSVAFDRHMTPALVEAAGTYYLPAAVNRQHGFGPVLDGFLYCRPMGEIRVRDVHADGLTAKLARHVRGCGYCGDPRDSVVPAERLLVGIALVPVPVGFTLSLALGGKTALAATSATSAGWSAKVLGALTKPAVAVTAGATIVAGGAYVVVQTPHGPAPRTAVSPTAVVGSAVPRAPAATPASSPTASPSASPTPSPSASARYGSVVDAVDRAPDPDTRPGALPHRPEAGITSTGGAHAVMNHRGDSVTLSGQGYVLVRWQISPQYRAGNLVMPSWTGLKGKIFHVASGGGRRMDDRVSTTDSSATGMGNSAVGYAVLPSGTQQMWQNEYFYVDGSVTLTVNERGADYGLSVFPSTWDAAEKDVLYGPPDGAIRYGLVRDDGTDSAPVPQYVTRKTPSDPATVAQRSVV